MSNQLSNAGASGLLGMLNVAPATPGQPVAAASGSTLPFGSVMQAQTAGAYPSQVDADGQLLPLEGDGLPPSGEMLEQMQARLAAEGRAPELSELTSESPLIDVLGPVLGDAESLHEGVVVKDQWLGLTPQNSEFNVEAPEVVALMQDIMAEQSAQVRPDIMPVRPDAWSEGDAGNASLDVSILPADVSTQNMAAYIDTDAVANDDAANVNTALFPESELAVTLSGNTQGSKGIEGHVGQPLNHEGADRVDQSVLPASTLIDTSVNTQNTETDPQSSSFRILPDAIPDAVSPSQTPEPVVQRPLVENPNGVLVAPPAMDSVPRNVGVSRAPNPRESMSVPTPLVNADNRGLTGHGPPVTQPVSPIVNTAPGVVSGSPVPPGSPDGTATTADMRLTPGEMADLLRAERAVGEGAQGGGEKADSGLRAEGRGFSSLLSAAAQVAVPADQAVKMTPTQTAFTLAGQGQMGSAPWRNALSERIMVMTAQNNQVAEIQLDPPELGSLKVRLQVGQDQVSVSFVSPHASVRDAVEQSMPRLREMMEQQGLNLGESSVNDQSSGSEEERRQERFASGTGDELSGGLEEQVSTQAGGEGLSLVDYYA